MTEHQTMEPLPKVVVRPSFVPTRTEVLQRKSLHSQPAARSVATIPPIVHEVLRTPGQPLDAATRAFMEPRFGHDFSQVRIRTSLPAAESVKTVSALAYTVGQDIVFGAGQYAPETSAGRKLMSHELAHVVQQSQSGDTGNAEWRAGVASECVTRGGAVAPEMVGGATPGFYAQGDEKEPRATTKETTRTLNVNWDELASFGAPQVSPPTLGLPSLTSPSLRRGLLGLPTPTIADRVLPPPKLIPSAPLVPADPAPTPALPSGISLASSGRFSLELQLGFPQIEAPKIPGSPASAEPQSLQQAQVMNQLLTGTVPKGWDAVDKAKLAQAIWGIFSTHIAPDVARKITNKLTRSARPPGTTYKLGIVILTDFSGGGLSFTLNF